MFIESFFRAHKRLQDLQRAHGSIEGLYRMITTPIPGTVDTVEARQKHKGPKVTTVFKILMRTAPMPVTVGTFETAMKA